MSGSQSAARSTTSPRFLARLDGLAAAIEAYANPDLVVDVLLLAWPRTRLAA